MVWGYSSSVMLSFIVVCHRMLLAFVSSKLRVLQKPYQGMSDQS